MRGRLCQTSGREAWSFAGVCALDVDDALEAVCDGVEDLR